MTPNLEMKIGLVNIGQLPHSFSIITTWYYLYSHIPIITTWYAKPSRYVLS